MTSEKAGGSGSPPDPKTPAITTEGKSYTNHQTHMRVLADRIRWLERARHWWLYTEAGAAQREFLERRAA